jgi:hypothetical protein
VSNAEDALVSLGEDLVREIKRGHDIMLSGPPVPDAVPVQADPSGLVQQTAPPPGCTKPGCFHDTLTCEHPLMRRHLVGGHPANRSRFISAASTEPPKGSSQPRGRQGR